MEHVVPADAVDDVAADAALRVVASSHAAGVVYAPIEFSTDRATIGGQSDLEPVPDVDADPEQRAAGAAGGKRFLRAGPGGSGGGVHGPAAGGLATRLP